MTNEEAIRRLIYQECRFCNDIPSTCEVIDCETKAAIEALEKQIPKKPKGDYDNAECPVCGANFHELGEDFAYCPDCGQAIDWSKDD